MSIIERAMNRMNGAGPGELEKNAPEVAASEPPPAPVEPAAAAPPPAPSAPVSTPSGPAPGAAVAEAPAAPKPVPRAPAAAPYRAQLPEPIGENCLYIDLERLAAAGLLVPDAPTSRQSEEYQQIKRRLLGNMVPGMLPHDRPANLIMITSSVPGEGKTFTSSNLALSIAMEVDHTVLAIDTDIVKSDLSRTFGVAGRVGLYDLLADDRLELKDLLIRTSIANLVLLPSGRNYEATTELLASQRMRDLCKEIAHRYKDRVVLFDSPPVLATTTAAALAPQVGQLVLVVEAGKTKQELVKESLQQLEGVQVTGVILNKSKQPVSRGYDYYGYYYRPNSEK
ncbi:MAG: polysaccharide biosynthesis tyrosine autokinase [Gammaproteobacteria bacterium]|nr:polysaccharide biosynthesis tyrosine autokinase [Gammaproteobacteria bacterium]